MGWRDTEQRIEAGVELVAVGAQRGVGERGAPSADSASPCRSLRRPGAKAASPASMAYWASRMKWPR